MGKWSVAFNGVLSNLGEESLNRIIDQFVDNREVFISSKSDALASVLFDILCETDVINHLSLDHFARLLNSVFPYSIRELLWLPKYCNTILDTVKDLEKYRLSERPARFYKYLKNTLIPELIADINKDDGKADFLNRLTDIYKVATALLYYLNNDVDFSMEITREMLIDLEKSIDTNANKNKSSFTPLEQSYAMFFSWILVEIISEQDGLTVEKGEEE